MNTDIEQFVKTLLVTNRDYDFFVNWDKATIVENYSVELHALDSLIKCNNFKTAFYDLLKKNSKRNKSVPVFNCNLCKGN